jgi:hypothetical protein
MDKITREQFVTYLNTTPTEDSETWSLVGVGVTSYGIAFNPQVTTEKWIINKAATSSLDSYQRQGDVSQKCYKGDPIFEYVNELRRTCGIGAEVQSQVLDIDRYDSTSDSKYKATKSDVIVVITNYMAEDAVIEYSIYYNGDPTQGTVTFADEKPTFVATV